jgi:CBS domain-containing protein
MQADAGEAERSHGLSGSVAELMTRRPISIAPTERADLAAAMMASLELRHLPVVERGRLAGILSLRDLLAASLPRGEAGEPARARHLRDLPVGSLMQRDLVTARSDATLEAAARGLLGDRIGCLPVVEGEALVGILTRHDFLGHACRLLARERERPRAAVERLMSRPVITVGPDDGLDVAHAIMKAERFHHLPVVEQDRLVGILSDHDVLACQGARPGETPAEALLRKHAVRVRDAMTRKVLTAEPGDEGARAGELMRRRRIGALPVVHGGRLTGILTASDFLYYLLSLPEA